MIASWMLYVLAIGILLTVASLAGERALRACGRPTRFVWAAALVLSIAWPLGPTFARLLPAPPPSMLPFTIVVQAPSVAADEPAALDRTALIDRGLVGVWLAASALLLFRLARGVSTLQRSRAGWKRARVNGTCVQLSENVGPAVVGLRSMDVVLPEWILSLDEPLRAIVLRHEEEHRNSRDPYLLAAAAIAVALIPWNVALWIQARRLRLAIEMDCDARVLRAHPSPERYGMLILTIAQRRSAAPALFAPMLSEPTTHLERRILAMRTTTRKAARMTVYSGGLVATLVLAFASSLQSAGTSFPKPRVPQTIAHAASAVPTALRLETVAVNAHAVPATAPTANEAAYPRGDSATRPAARDLPKQQQGNPPPRYPDALKAAGVEGAVFVRFTTDARGAVDSNTIQIVSSTHVLFTNAVRKVLPLWHAAPSSTIKAPFIFLIADCSGTDCQGRLGAVPAGAVVVTAITPAAGRVVPSLEAVHITALDNQTASDSAPAAGAIRPGATRGAARSTSADQTFFEFQVERRASPVPGNKGPRYPDELRSAKIEGDVIAQFIVDTTGAPEMSTFKVLKSSHELFTSAVVAALPNMKFYPATVGGRAVRQLIQMPFVFSLSRERE